LIETGDASPMVLGRFRGHRTHRVDEEEAGDIVALRTARDATVATPMLRSSVQRRDRAQPIDPANPVG